MKGILLVSLSLLAISTPVSVLAEPAKASSVKELMELTGAGNMAVQMMNQMVPALKTMAPDAPESFWQDFMASVDPSDLENKMIPVYQKYLTEADLQQINAFYASETGKKLIKYQPAIIQESMQIGQEWGQELGMKVMMKYQQSQ